MSKGGRKPKYPLWVRELINSRFKKNPERWIITHFFDMSKEELKFMLNRYNSRVNEALGVYKNSRSNSDYWKFKETKNCCVVLRKILNYNFPGWNEKFNNNFFDYTTDLNICNPVSSSYSNNEGKFINIAFNEDESCFCNYSNDTANPSSCDTVSRFTPREGIWSMNDEGVWEKE